MASSASEQDDPNRAMWLATRAGKMEPSCPLGTTRCIPQEKFPRKPYNKSFFDQVCLVKMAGYWRRSFFASLWTSSTTFCEQQTKIVFLVINLPVNSVNSVNLNFFFQLHIPRYVATFVSFTGNHKSRISEQFSRFLGHPFWSKDEPKWSARPIYIGLGSCLWGSKFCSEEYSIAPRTYFCLNGGRRLK